jgi:predicted XRE-type DNA-binding protein
LVEVKKLPAAFYCSAARNEPVRERLQSLESADRRIIGQDIATAEFGWPIGMPVCRSLGWGLYEIRSDLAKPTYRARRVLRNGRTHAAPAWIYQEDAENAASRSGSGAKAYEGGDVMKRKSGSRKKGRIGSSFDDYLKDEGVYEELSAVAIKRVLAWQLEEAMKKDGVSKNEMAKRMHTSRSQLDRILDPDNDKIQLDTVFKAAQVLGREVKMELV